MILLSESAKEKLERERFYRTALMTGRQLGRAFSTIEWISRLQAEARYPHTSLKKTFRHSEVAKACRMAIDVISDEWLDKHFGGAA